VLYQLKKRRTYSGGFGYRFRARIFAAVVLAVPALFSVAAYPAELAWEADVHAAAAPVYYDGMVIVASADKYLRAFDAETGEKIWDVRFKTPLTYTPAAADGLICVTVLHPENKLVCLSAEKGKRLWSVPLADPATAPAIVSGGAVVGSGDFLVLFGADGETIKKVKTDSRVDAVYDYESGVIAAYVTGEAVLFDRELDYVIATVELGPGRSYPLPVDDGVLFARYDGEAVMTGPDLNPVWRVDLPGRVTSAPVRCDDGYIIGCLGGGVVYLSKSGCTKWFTPLGANVKSSPVSVIGGVYALTETGVIYVLDDAGVATEFARLEFKSKCGLLSYDGRIFAADDEGRITVYDINGK
jgi:outer membrane protein assembly factor BamB